MKSHCGSTSLSAQAKNSLLLATNCRVKDNLLPVYTGGVTRHISRVAINGDDVFVLERFFKKITFYCGHSLREPSHLFIPEPA